ncbi:hypothetical protein [Gluconobacter cerinus]|uniref:hypothetical protein n=1 Tax=Gluconobacter cerinus TaxID=38307 RepID=UPI001C048B82|nr:hypothetical protein [Gluconobacter cerinus]
MTCLALAAQFVLRNVAPCCSLFLAPSAFAQTQAANPAELFVYGKRAGVSAPPLVTLAVGQTFLVVSLPSTCTDGTLALATDGRTPIEPSGAGTGVVARCL